MFCTNCGHELNKEDKFCSHCGKKVNQDRIPLMSSSSEDKGAERISLIESPDRIEIHYPKVKVLEKKPRMCLNRVQFLVAFLVSAMFFGAIQSQLMSEHMIDKDGALIVIWCLNSLILLVLAKFRCNHIGFSTNNYIWICITLFFPVISLFTIGYLIFKRGNDPKAGF